MLSGGGVAVAVVVAVERVDDGGAVLVVGDVAGSSPVDDQRQVDRERLCNENREQNM